MNTAGRLGVCGAALLAVFGIAFALAAAFVPDDAAARWTGVDSDHGSHASNTSGPTAAEVVGLGSSQDGYLLTEVSAPSTTGVAGTLAFRIADATGTPVTAYQTEHGKRLHLIVVRSDGADYRHVHPQLDPRTGVWSIPWTWAQAGTYRVIADFTPISGPGITVSRTVDVAGALVPHTTSGPVTSTVVDGFTVTLAGGLTPGTSTELTATVRRDGATVTALQPYLGAFGHLVALRAGDLAYLHVHAMGDEPTPGATAGPDVAFMATAPSAGRYFLYLDFQVDGVVRTAAFVLETTDSSTSSPAPTGGGHEH